MNIAGLVRISALIIFIATAVFFVAVAVMIIRGIRRSMRNAVGGGLNEIFGNADSAAKGFYEGMTEDDRPKSVGGGDSLFLPRILKDFPEFSLSTAKAAVRERIEEEMAGKDSLKIHNIAITNYTAAGNEREIVFGCAFEYAGGAGRVQKRYALHYLYANTGDQPTVAVCQSCGAPIGSAAQETCEYCGCRIVNVTGASWKITQVYER